MYIYRSEISGPVFFTFSVVSVGNRFASIRLSTKSYATNVTLPV